MLLSQVVAASAPGLHHDGALWQFSSIIGLPVALMSAAHKLMFMAEPHWSIFTLYETRRAVNAINGGKKETTEDRRGGPSE